MSKPLSTPNGNAEPNATYVVRLPDGGEYGPLSAQELRDAIKHATLPPTSFVRKSSSTSWRMVADLTPTGGTIAKSDQGASYGGLTMPPAKPPVPPATPSSIGSVSATSAGLLPKLSESRPSPPSLPNLHKPPAAQDPAIPEWVFVVVGISISISLFIGLTWVRNASGIPPFLFSRGGRFLLLALPAVGTGLYALYKAAASSENKG